MLLLHHDGGWNEFAEPKGIVRTTVCSLSGKLPGGSCPGTVEEIFVRGTEPREVCARHGRQLTTGQISENRKQNSTSQGLWILFPHSGDIFQIDPVLRDDHQRIKLKLSLAPGPPVGKVEWLVNGRKVGEAAHPYSIFWNLLPGSYTIRARTTRGRQIVESRPVRITVLS
jgi:penicillin-binding protein 1C